MIKTYNMIIHELHDYRNPKTKLGRLVKEGVYTPVIRGLYETDPNTAGYLLAGSIYGPSYLSFDFALVYVFPEVTEYAFPSCPSSSMIWRTAAARAVRVMYWRGMAGSCSYSW